MTTTSDKLRRSPLQYELAQCGAIVPARADAASASAQGDACVIVDLSPLPRIGFKGWSVWTSLTASGIPVPARNNTAVALSAGGVCARLGDAEALILAAPDGSQLPPDAAGLEDSDGLFVVPRRDTHAWIALAGSETPELLAKLCAVDFRLGRFADLSIAQTMVAGIGAIVLRWDHHGAPVFHLLMDSMSAIYLWRMTLEVAAIHGGRPAGLDYLRSLANPAARVN